MVDTFNPMPESGPGHRHLRRRRVLLAFGSPLVRTRLASALESDGFHVVALADGVQALDALEASGAPGEPQYPDLLVVARHLAGLGGVEVLGALRLGDARTPVIVLAATADRAARCWVLDLAGAVLLEGAIDPAEVTSWARRLVTVHT